MRSLSIVCRAAGAALLLACASGGALADTGASAAKADGVKRAGASTHAPATPADAAGTANVANAAGVASSATIPTDPAALQALVLDLDRRMFAAYDAHDVDGLMAWFAPELEFFHDTGGLLDWAQVKAGFTNVFAHNADIRRELEPGSTRVYPVHEYGAIQIGRHRFCHTENGKPDCGTFEFVQVWRLRDGKWQVTRELSYGH